MRAVVLATALAVNAYLLGVMLLFACVVYPAFGAVAHEAFPAAYAAFNGRIGLPVVVPEFLALLVTLALYRARPSSLGAVHAIVALGVGYFVITFAWHLPSHRALALGDNSAAALAPLLLSQGARTVVHAVRVGLLAFLTVRASSS